MKFEKLSEIMRDSGIVGAGGAGFPAYAKLNATADYNDDTDMGYSVEVKIPLQMLDLDASGGYVMYLNMQNSDKGTKTNIDQLAGSEILDKSTWVSVKTK